MDEDTVHYGWGMRIKDAEIFLAALEPHEGEDEETDHLLARLRLFLEKHKRDSWRHSR